MTLPQSQSAEVVELGFEPIPLAPGPMILPCCFATCTILLGKGGEGSHQEAEGGGKSVRCRVGQADLGCHPVWGDHPQSDISHTPRPQRSCAGLIKSTGLASLCQKPAAGRAQSQVVGMDLDRTGPVSCGSLTCSPTRERDLNGGSTRERACHSTGT